MSKSMECDTFSRQCSDTVGWSTGRASGLLKVGCWFVGDEAVTEALHVLQLQLSLAAIESGMETL